MSYRDEQREALLKYVGEWFDKCVEIGALDDDCEMGKLKIAMYDGGGCIRGEDRVISINVTPTFPLEQL